MTIIDSEMLWHQFGAAIDMLGVYMKKHLQVVIDVENVILGPCFDSQIV